MATQPMSAPALPQLKPSDLTDKNLWALNNVFATVWKHVIRLSGGAGPVTIPNTVIATDFQNPSQSQPPTDNTSLITLGSALQLFAPANARAAQLQGAFQTQSTSVQQVQPLPLGSQVVAGTPGSSASAGSAGQIMYDANFLYINTGGAWKRVALASF